MGEKSTRKEGGKTAPANFLMNENVPPENPATAKGQVTAWSNASAPPAPTTTVSGLSCRRACRPSGASART